MLLLPSGSPLPGTTAGLVPVQQGGRATIRSKAQPRDPSTPQQWAVRPRFRETRASWRLLTQGQRDGWDLAASGLGLQGHELWTAVGERQLLAGQELVPAPADAGDTIPGGLPSQPLSLTTAEVAVRWLIDPHDATRWLLVSHTPFTGVGPDGALNRYRLQAVAQVPASGSVQQIDSSGPAAWPILPDRAPSSLAVRAVLVGADNGVSDPLGPVVFTVL